MAAVFINNEINNRKIKVYKRRLTLFDLNLTDNECIERYRLRREDIHFLVGVCDRALQLDSRGSGIPPETQVLITLRYLAKGNFFSELADIHGVSRSSVCRIIPRVVTAINENVDNIRFPRGQELLATKLGFYRYCRLPNIIGAIDGTHIPIIAPTDNEPAYICRKGFHSINVQAVVDSSMRFTDVVSRWPGSTHDASIFDTCGLKEYIEGNDIGQLLGDKGYPLRTYLLTPYCNPTSPRETLYNTRHSFGRVVVERAFGILKSRFRCLHKTGGCLPFSPEKSAMLVTACCRLHNMCIDRGLDIEPIVIHEEDDNQGLPEALNARNLRDKIADHLRQY